MSQSVPQKGHPKGLYILFATEMWERFNYYGMRAILILFMTKALLFSDAFASNLYGSYTGLVYLTPLIGGYIADRYWGNKRSIIVGGLVMAIGEFLLFFCGSLYESAPGLSTMFFFSGLGFMIAGNGFFKPNISSLVGQLYPKNDRRTDAAYTIFYMGINVGGAIGPFLCGMAGDTGNPADFKWAFLVAGIGMLISVLVQKLYQDKYIVSPEGVPLGNPNPNAPKAWSNPVLIVLGCLLFSGVAIGVLYVDANVFSFLSYLLIASFLFIVFVLYSDKSLTRIEKQKITVIIITAFFVIFFWSAFEQAGASLNLFADRQTDRFLGWVVPKYYLYIISAALLGVLGWCWKKATTNLALNDKSLLNGVKVLLIVLAGALLYYDIKVGMEPGANIEMNEVPASYFQSLNSIFVISFAPLFAWLWLKLGRFEPSAPTKMAIGLFLLALGYLWIAFGVKDAGAVKVSMVWLIGMYALHTWGELCLSPIGLSLVNKLAPLKYASLLMAVWFLANAAANKFAGVLSALYPGSGKTTRFLFYEMTNLYDFFILFLGMAGVASLILFGITKQLQKMMTQESK
ncbi:MAG: peptide MFS transporter [Candidatus Pseudobacter hemicellulosilyticus]|uniref:Peptide MFS transporter n=1 Tax=Candidatus Pseudobacter hemicellulosilyticus TaxID=3121375 RepID=A0AAJ5WVN8_9BACT|nr:MAG: peptide MFS transporter [Pseudobacter sp.]